MQIHLFAIIQNRAIHAVLPAPDGWSVKAERVQSRKRTLTGAYITQFSAKMAAECDAAYDTLADQRQADQAEIIDANLTSSDKCFLSDGRHVYETVPDLTFATAYKKTRVSGKFSIVRLIL